LAGWFSADTVEDLNAAAKLDIGVLALDMVAAVLAIVVVRRLTGRQDERASRLAGAQPEPT
jgi:hypothetical protein